MPDYSAALTHRIAPAILEFIRRTAPACVPARRLSAAAVEAQFESLARELFAAQFALNPPYQALCRGRGILPERVESWRNIPAVPTAVFKELEVSAVPVAERIRVFHSSGTTRQQPGRNWHSRDSLAVYEASLLEWFAPHVLSEIPSLIADGFLEPDQAPVFISLTPPAAAVPTSSLVHMFDVAIRKFGARDSVFAGRLDSTGAWELDFDRLHQALQESMCAHRPVFIVGTAFNFVQLLDHFATNNLRYRLAVGSRVLETGGYKGRTRAIPKLELHRAITERLGIPCQRIGSEYGMCELASQAYDQPTEKPGRFYFPPWARVRVVSPENGEEVADGQPGILQIFDLANIGSVAAIQTGDLGRRHRDGSFELLDRAESAEPKGCSLQTAA